MQWRHHAFRQCDYDVITNHGPDTVCPIMPYFHCTVVQQTCISILIASDKSVSVTGQLYLCFLFFYLLSFLCNICSVHKTFNYSSYIVHVH